MRPKKSVGLKDIADALHVSVVTVSNALSGKSGVSEENRRKIAEKAAELRYEYTPKKTSYKEKGTRISIAYWNKGQQKVIKSKGAGEVEEAFQTCLNEVLTAKGYRIHRGRPIQGCEGLIVSGKWTGAELEKLTQAFQFPIVVIGNFTPYVAVDYIINDCYHAAFERAKTLYNQNWKISLILSSPDSDPDLNIDSATSSEDADRLGGFLLAGFYYGKNSTSEKRDLYEISKVSRTVYGRTSPESETGKILPYSGDSQAVFPDREVFWKWIDSANPEDRPDAIACADERDRVILQTEAKERGIQFSGGIWDSGVPDPEALAQEAAAVLLQRIRAGDKPHGVHFVREKL